MSQPGPEEGFAVFGFSTNEDWTDRGGYDTDPVEWGVAILLRSDGSANAYELSIPASERVRDEEPTLVGFWASQDEGIQLELKRIKKPDERELPLPAGELYWYPIETEQFFADGSRVMQIISNDQLKNGTYTFDRISGDLVIDQN